MRISDWSSDVCSSDLYDVSSPWTYLAFTNIQPLAKEAGATIHWKPFLVGGVFNTVNPTMYRMRENPVPARDAWIMKDMQDWARLAGIRIVRSEEHTSELQSLMRTSYAVFCLKKKTLRT